MTTLLLWLLLRRLLGCIALFVYSKNSAQHLLCGQNGQDTVPTSEEAAGSVGERPKHTGGMEHWVQWELGLGK